MVARSLTPIPGDPLTVPFLSTFSKSARLFYPIAVKAVANNVSANQAIGAFLASGGRIRRQSALQVMRAVAGVEEAGAQLQFLRLNFAPDPRRLPEALTELRRAFSFRVRISGTDISTGDPFERFVTVALDDVASRQDIEQMATSFVFQDRERYGIDLDNVQLMSGSKAGPQGTLLPREIA